MISQSIEHNSWKNQALALLVTLDGSKPEHKVVPAKVNVDFLRIFELADSIKLALDDLGCRKKSKHKVECGLSSARSANAGGLIWRLPTLGLTQFSGASLSEHSAVTGLFYIEDLKSTKRCGRNVEVILAVSKSRTGSTVHNQYPQGLHISSPGLHTTTPTLVPI
ncbi:hypothetical protein EVAR_6031_1 [Eumeta japonica]|uniref:Uncharacterized protein n=1 Tax=Eumeta variegata TaxID=151549 RepID=A0A4C1TC97_EUMVA|nr:hypothetical protein EVAR_6031_1 [Eumeta japonica]